jgi:glutaredoxin
MKENYIILVKDNCPFCINAVELIEKLDLPNKVVKFDKKQASLLEDFKTAYDYKTVPMIFRRLGNDIKFLGGYSDLVEFFDLCEDDG